jgi:hypothetical protein
VNAASDAGPSTATAASGVVRVVPFEDCGDCTLARVAHEACEGDDVLVLGPEAFAMRLRALGLSDGVRIHRVGRFAGRWRPKEVGRCLHALGAGWTGARATYLYGRAQFDARIAGDDATHLARCPDRLPTMPDFPAARRERIRRELGLLRHDFAVLVAGDPSSWIDIGLLARAAGMAHVALAGRGVRIRLIASPAVPRLAERSRFLLDAVDAAPIAVDVRVDQPWTLLGAVDALAVDQDGLATDPVSCAGDRCAKAQALGPMQPSPLPALWALAAGVPALVHRTVDLGAHADGPQAALIHRFDDEVAPLARLLHDVALQDRARSASAASR